MGFKGMVGFSGYVGFSSNVEFRGGHRRMLNCMFLVAD